MRIINRGDRKSRFVRFNCTNCRCRYEIDKLKDEYKPVVRMGFMSYITRCPNCGDEVCSYDGPGVVLIEAREIN